MKTYSNLLTSSKDLIGAINEIYELVQISGEGNIVDVNLPQVSVQDVYPEVLDFGSGQSDPSFKLLSTTLDINVQSVLDEGGILRIHHNGETQFVKFTNIPAQSSPVVPSFYRATVPFNLSVKRSYDLQEFILHCNQIRISGNKISFHISDVKESLLSFTIHSSYAETTLNQDIVNEFLQTCETETAGSFEGYEQRLCIANPNLPNKCTGSSIQVRQAAISYDIRFNNPFSNQYPDVLYDGLFYNVNYFDSTFLKQK